MIQVPSLDDFELVSKYTDQPSRLPGAARLELESAAGHPIIAYALTDLDALLRLSERWLVLTSEHVILWAQGEPPLVQARSSVERCSVDAGLSCNTLRTERRAGQEPLVLRYTQ